MSWVQPGTLSLVGVILLWQQVRFLSQRVDEFKQETNAKLEEMKQEINAKLEEAKRETNTRLDRTDAKLDRIIDILLMNALQASKVSSAAEGASSPAPTGLTES